MSNQKMWKLASDEYREDASFAVVLAESKEEARDKANQEEERLGVRVRNYPLEAIEEVIFNGAGIFWI